MKTSAPRRSPPANAPKIRALKVKLSAAKKKSDSARKVAHDAKVGFKEARKVYKDARKRAKEARKEAKALKKALVAATKKVAVKPAPKPKAENRRSTATAGGRPLPSQPGDGAAEIAPPSRLRRRVGSAPCRIVRPSHPFGSSVNRNSYIVDRKFRSAIPYCCG